ncbi:MULTISPECIES: helix-turn-helix domain-containing protein [Bradyrhizobium]|jgi:transcriptional regulator of acetoin/glycerol metabolism|uniref:helix-turn-helix domain-containing protein n=1 Tax=Bradyrhizobium TaxID=374 RepID=UPI001449D6B6|nr:MULTISPECIES: helix-turn-helix domain-containing protein [Bradyrhizobium]MBP2434563.1 transcriptional regulator of acetoin/glycerol metabolism [Bradyrhizobium elkanii]MCP1932972.1 transcriptional regulator of acetoin/glycerol metabolism [Bradyrhizobium elkanii]MCP1968797.1 transcriptional regulator of acetoin/glycerol metabolism [Bradyrhizobium elkanii]MCS3479016.1 transcriptional regulator of acetoin/glycerol metabolism [Bradyrhizobium elkanii]MCS3524884.1 transcriptional regulator of acet
MSRSLGVMHTDKVLDVLAGRGAPSDLSASWRRSGHLHALDPASRLPSHRLSQADIAAAQQRLGGFLKVAQSTLDRLFLAVGGVGCSVLLADRDGVVVDRRGAGADDATFDAWGLWTGAVWSEKYEGTNGIGTCIVEKRPLSIDREQHFFTRNSGLFCTTAPIFDEHGELAAALDVSSCRADLTGGFSRLIATTVTDAARTIEAENFRRAFPDARILLTPKSERAVNSLLAVDRDDLVIGATRAARRALGLNAASLARPLPAADLIGETRDAGDLAAAERAALQRALARAGGNVSKAARDLDMSRATLHRKLKQLGLHR